MAKTIKRYNKHNSDVDVVSNPEFQREGCAVEDLLHPDRVVIGAPNKQVAMILMELYATLGAPVFITDVKSAEIIKYASNAFLALKISYVNAIAAVAEAVAADDGVSPSQVLDLLTHLVDKSIVRVDHTHPVGRYRFLESIRQFQSVS